MPAMSLRPQRLATLVAALALAGCGSVDRFSRNITDSITPFRIEVVQGNFVSREQVEQLKPGMSRQQARELLGTPLVASLFHADRWDYVFTLKRQGVAAQERKVAVFFKGDAFERVEGDAMPSEAEFVATLERRRKDAPVPELQAGEEKLKAFNGKSDAPAAAPAAPAAPRAASYPPLEPPPR
jgi:outer membrane protein assembly factor BamE